MAQDFVKFWVLGDDGEKYGPIGLEVLKEWLAEDRVGPDSQAALDAGGKPSERWQRLDLYPESAVLWQVEESRAEVLAPLWRRVIAGLIDVVFVFTLLGASLSLVLIHHLGLNSKDIEVLSQVILQASVGEGVNESVERLIMMVNILGYASMVVYFGYFHLRYAGRTLGLMVCGLKVISEDEQTMRVGQALLRTAGVVVTISFYGLGFLFALFTRRRQALQDLVSRTIVVKNRVKR